MHAIIVNLLWSFLGTETFKTIIRKGVRKLVDSTNTSIDPELARSLIVDISESNGNNLTKEIATTIIKEL